MRRLLSSLSAVVLVVASTALSGQVVSRLPATKKLIEYGWDVPTPAFVRAHIREMEKRPFDGLMMRLAGGNRGNVFCDGRWQETDFTADIEALRAIQWERFRHNFLMIYSASDMDWFSDDDWDDVQFNVRLVARAAKAGGCHLTFDAEPYGANPWHYPSQAHKATKGFAEYRAVARRRGAQFMNAIQAELPTVVVHTFFTFSYAAKFARDEDLYARLEEHHYGLYFDFLNGMLEAAGAGVTITDGNERSYYYQDSESFFQSYHAMRQVGMRLVAPTNIAAFLTQTQAAQALYVDHLFDLRARTFLSHYMAPDERARWFEHNVYWALTTSDEFVWLYSEKMNWWQNQVPDGLEQAVVSAREKVAAGKPLGYDMVAIVDRAKERQQAALADKLVRRQATVRRIAEPPTVDGTVAPGEWQSATPLPAFLPYVETRDAPQVVTSGWVAYDDRFLYVCVVCPEPAPETLRSAGNARDDSIWLGDSVDLFVTDKPDCVPYAHVIVAPNGTRWDARFSGDNDLTWDPEWQVRTATTDGQWIAEMAVPWQELGVIPKSGLKLRANVCRQRLAAREHTTWSQCVGGFTEHEHFGTWILE